MQPLSMDVEPLAGFVALSYKRNLNWRRVADIATNSHPLSPNKDVV